ncbi:MAG: glycosyltransferase family 2 protein [Hyphomonas sp.]|nr:glycosyltransferase family 2 protein [Hyphomonas sp.]
MTLQPSAPPEFSVLIVNYNGGAYVQDALDSLSRQTFRDFEVILIDNASTDGSVDKLDTRDLPGFVLLAESENHGYAGGMNRAAARARGRWLVGLNPDAVADAAWLGEIHAGLKRHPTTSMFASAQYDRADPGILDGAGDAYLVFGMPWRGGFGRPASELPGEGECFSPCGAGGVFGRDVFHAHGGFDESYFCFCEDVDLGFRLRLAGETCVFLPKAVIHHVGGGLSGRASDFSIYHGSRNRIWTYAKDMPAPLFWITLPGHAALSAYILVRGVMTGRVRQTWRGMWDGVLGAAEMRRKGRQSRKHMRVPLWHLARAMAWNPFRMSQRKVHVRELADLAPISGSSASKAL